MFVDMMGGWMDGWMVDVLIATVDTSASWYTQCEDITIVAIRIMRLRGMDEQRKIEIYCVMI